MDKDQVRDYYDHCHNDYRRIWHLDRCQAMHLGFWDGQVRRLREALQRENAVLAEMASVRAGDRVLDAGCGVGGSAIYLARHRDCRVDGITLSEKQVSHARTYAGQAGVQEQLNFLVADFTRTPFRDQSYDVIWAVESVCHAASKPAFLAEAYRLLKPGGRLIVADGFRCDRALPAAKERLLLDSFEGWGVTSLEGVDSFSRSLSRAGFSDTIRKDVSKLVYRSSRRLYWCSFPATAVDWVERLMYRRAALGRGNVIAARKQYQSLQQQLWSYQVFLATR